MQHLPGKCPICQGALTVTEVCCDACGSSVRGRFALSPFERLGEGEAEFLRLFVLSRGNLRRLGQRLGISYPTVRARLDEVVQALEDGYAATVGEK